MEGHYVTLSNLSLIIEIAMSKYLAERWEKRSICSTIRVIRVHDVRIGHLFWVTALSGR